MNRLREAFPTLALVVLLAACGAPADRTESGSGGVPATADPDAPVGCYDPAAPREEIGALTPCPDLGEPAGPQKLEPRDDLVDVAPHRWDRVEVDDDGRSLDVLFWGGVEDCYGVDRVEVEERPRRVVVTLYTGRVPTAEVCIEIAVEQFVEVTLAEPVGDRRIVDGSAAAG